MILNNTLLKLVFVFLLLYCMKVKILMGGWLPDIAHFQANTVSDIGTSEQTIIYIFLFSGVCVPQRPESLICLLRLWQGYKAPA